ncbi:hypothetical protein BBP40_007027 [Aspergillus hancockii]|nr:hypothetical protein BBP40_007027 [Aspergillus hancockii]
MSAAASSAAACSSLDSQFNSSGDELTGLESWDPWATLDASYFQQSIASSTPLYPTPIIESIPTSVNNDLTSALEFYENQDILQPLDAGLMYPEDYHPEPTMTLLPPPVAMTTSPSANSLSASTSPSDSVATPAVSSKPSAPSRIEKRQQNTLAARRYRQRRVDQMKSLEDELRKVREERDALKMRVSKLEGETEALRCLLGREKK